VASVCSTEAAFTFYRSVFATEFAGPIARFRDIPAQPGQPPVSPGDGDLVMHVELPILGGHVLMGTDARESSGFKLTAGNHIPPNPDPDTPAETGPRDPINGKGNLRTCGSLICDRRFEVAELLFGFIACNAVPSLHRTRP